MTDFVEKQIEHKYIFPDFLAKFMSKVDLRTQLEASMMSMSLMMVGLILSVSYFAIFGAFPLWFRITLGLNGIFGLIFMWSFLITTYQQYLSYMEAKEFQENINQKSEIESPYEKEMVL